jgi:hypothetical protein
VPRAAGIVRSLNIERAQALRSGSRPRDRNGRAAGKRLPANRELEIHTRRIKPQARVVTDRKVAVGEKPLYVIGVVTQLQRQPRSIRAYKRKVLEEHSVTANVQARDTCSI